MVEIFNRRAASCIPREKQDGVSRAFPSLGWSSVTGFKTAAGSAANILQSAPLFANKTACSRNTIFPDLRSPGPERNYTIAVDWPMLAKP
ncbi:hypothetical protein NKI25_27235 [Mesorhizobium sp. M0808]|uniref:hypothetical protein n=1 Tax=Mesorhizobium sp. M0808 TaxID=2957002 RepID=UPI00333A03F2